MKVRLGDLVHPPQRFRCGSISERSPPHHPWGLQYLTDMGYSVNGTMAVVICVKSSTSEADCMFLLPGGTTGWAWSSELNPLRDRDSAKR